MILVGIDEAGYGPTLGPLVVSASAFRIAEPETDLWEVLRESVTRKPDGARVPVNDSKKIHRPGKGLGPLEEGVIPFVRCCLDPPPADLRSLLCYLGRSTGAAGYLESYPWYRGRNLDLPADSYGNLLRVLAERLRGDLERGGVEFLGLASAPVEVIRFNEILDASRNKAMVPFSAISMILRRVARTFRDEDVHVVVDRQGGRINYARLLFEHVKPRSIGIETQSGELSRYVLRGRRRAMHVTFTREGDSKSFAVALASMTSKYIRELHMTLFNRFWHEHAESLRPTAGYPTDARRFLRETAALRRRMGVADDILIRRR